MTNFDETRDSILVEICFFIGTGCSLLATIFMFASLSYYIFYKKQLHSSLILVFSLTFFDFVLSFSNLLLIFDRDYKNIDAVCYLRGILYYVGVICSMNVVNMISWIILRSFQQKEPSTRAKIIFYLIFIIALPFAFLLTASLTKNFPGRFNFWCAIEFESIYIVVFWEIIRISTISWAFFVYFQLNRKKLAPGVKKLIDYYKYFVIVLVGTWSLCFINSFSYYIRCIKWDCDELPVWFQAIDGLAVNCQGLFNGFCYGKNLLANTKKTIRKSNESYLKQDIDETCIQ